MLKATILDGKLFPMILMDSQPTEVIDGSQLIPLEFGGKLLPPRVMQTASLTELGKALLKAAEEGDTEEVRKLMSKGAPFTADWLGTSPLHFAAQRNHLETCRVLLRAGISRDARTKVERTPLHLATYEGHDEIVQVLLENGADVDAQDMLKMTPLHWAVQNGHTDIVRMLVRNGANIDIVSKFDVTPLDLALELGKTHLAEILTLEIRNPLGDENGKDMEDEGVDEGFFTSMNVIDNSMQETQRLVVEDPPLETVLLEDDDEECNVENSSPQFTNSNNATSNTTNSSTTTTNEVSNYSDTMQLLRQHGITMLPNEDDTILSSAIDSGHSMVLTEAGKQMLNQTKPSSVPSLKKTPVSIQKVKKIVIPKGKATYKRIFIAKKNPTINPITTTITNSNATTPKKDDSNDLENVRRQLHEARKLAEEYKKKFLLKEAEAAGYKHQLELISQQNRR